MKAALVWVVLVVTVVLIAASPASAGFSFSRVDHPMADTANPSHVQSPYAVALGDLDGVNGQDIVVANYGNLIGTAYNGTIAVMLNNGNGTFGQPAIYDSGRAGIVG